MGLEVECLVLTIQEISLTSSISVEYLMNQELQAVDLTSLRNAGDLMRQCWKCSRRLIKAFFLFYCNTNVLNEYFSLVLYKGLLLNFQKQLLTETK